MRTTRAAGAAAVLAGVLAAAGCSGGSGERAASPAPSLTSTSGVAPGEPTPSQAPSTTTSSPSSTPTAKSTEAGAPGVPKAARQHTKAGAEAFVRHYTDVINETSIHPKVGMLEPLAMDSCKSCDNQEKTVRELVRDDQRFTMRQMDVISTRVLGGSTGTTQVELHGYEPNVDIVDNRGNSVESYPEVKNQGMVFELKWTPNGWRVVTIKTMM